MNKKCGLEFVTIHLPSPIKDADDSDSEVVEKDEMVSSGLNAMALEMVEG